MSNSCSVDNNQLLHEVDIFKNNLPYLAYKFSYFILLYITKFPKNVMPILLLFCGINKL